MGSSNLPGSVMTTFLNRLGSGAGPGSDAILYAESKLMINTAKASPNNLVNKLAEKGFELQDSQ